MISAPDRWRATPVVAVLVVVITILAGPPAHAEPSAQPSEEAGVAPTLLEQLEQTNRAYLEAKAISDASKARQAQIRLDLQKAEKRLAELADEVGSTANAAYRGSKFNLTAALISTDRTADELLQGVTTVSYLTYRDDKQLREFTVARKEYVKQLKAMEAEVKLQEEQARQMEKRTAETKKALDFVGNGGVVNGVPVPTPTANPAPRNANGGFSPENATVDDPTTAGRITPRLLNALRQAQKAGFTRFVGCFRPGDRFEHPKGRACDFSVQQKGFGGDATADARNYGDRLAGYFVSNAERLGVLYVIFYRIIWTPAGKWYAYDGAGGDPSSDHTNHVHLSII